MNTSANIKNERERERGYKCSKVKHVNVKIFSGEGMKNTFRFQVTKRQGKV